MGQGLVRQRYLNGFEGGDLSPPRARMCEAYVNGVDGELVDDLTLCRLGGFRPKDGNSARTTVWKVFEGSGKDGKYAETYKAEREYVLFLQAQAVVKSEWSGEEIMRRLQRNVMLAQGEIPYQKLVTGSYKGHITTKSVRVAEINLPAANTALHLLGKQQGMFKEQTELSGPDGQPLAGPREVHYVNANNLKAVQGSVSDDDA